MGAIGPGKGLLCLGSVAVLWGLSISCGRPVPPATAPLGDSSLVLRGTVVLNRPVEAQSIYVAGDTFYLAEDKPEKFVSRWGPDGRELPRPLPPGSEPGQILEASDSFLRFPSGLLGILDYRSYRVNVIEVATARFVRSFVVTPYNFMALNGAGDPDRGRLYLFAALKSPGVHVLDFEGREISPGLDYFDKAELGPYARFRMTVDGAGNLYYCPRSWYKVLCVSPGGEPSLFAERATGSYRRPAPVPTWLSDQTSDDKRHEWEGQYSWVRQLAVSGARIVVCYSVPPGFHRHVIDVYDPTGRLVHGEIPVPGRLLGCGQSQECWFLVDSDRSRLAKVEIL